MSAVRNLAAAAFLLSISACSDVVEERYATWSDADKAGAIERGWIPSFVPSTAREIHDTHNLDTNAQKLMFAVPPTDIPKMVGGLRSVGGENTQGFVELAREVDMQGSTVEAYAVCSKLPVTGDWPGALVVNRQSGRAIFKAPVESIYGACADRDS